MLPEIRAKLIARLNTMASKSLRHEIVTVEADEDIEDVVIFTLVSGVQSSVIILEEGDRFCFCFEESGQQILLPKADLLGEPN